MNKLKKMIIVSIISSIMLTCLFTLNVQAKSDFKPLNDSDSIITYNQSIGRSAQSTNELFSHYQNFNASQPILSDIKIAYMDGLLRFSGVLTYKEKTLFINTCGQMYRNEKTTNSGKYGNLILVDMEDSKEWHFVRFSIDKDSNQLSIILQNKSNRELLQFIIDISTDQYIELYNFCDNPIKGKDLEEKIIRMYNVSKNLIGSKNSSVNYTKLNDSSVGLNQQRVTSKASYSGYKSMMDKLKNNMKVDTSSLTNVDMGMFIGDGWQRDMNFENGDELSYDFITYCVPNGPDRYLVQMSLSSIIKKQERLANNKVKEVIDYTYYDGMVVEYDTVIKEISVLYYDMGIMIRNLELAIGTNSENAYFLNQKINGNCSGTGNPFLQAIGGWADPTDVVVSLFIALNNYESGEINRLRKFPETIEGQKEFNDGKLIQVIAVSSGSRKLERAGHNLYIEGDILFSNYLQAYYSYKFEEGTIL